MNALIEYLILHFGIDKLTATTLVISLFTTLTVLIFGKFIDFIYKEIVEFKSRKVYRKTLCDIIEDISNSCIIQSTAFSLFVKELDIKHIGHYKMVSGNIDLLNTFQKMSFSTFYGAYYKGIENICNDEKNKEIRKIYSNTEKLTGFENRLLIDIKEFNERYGNCQESWKEIIGKLMKFIETTLTAYLILPAGIKPDPFYLKIDRIFSDWQNSPEHIYPYVVYDKLLIPLYEFLRLKENIKRIRDVYPLLDDLREAILVYKNIETVLTFYSDVFKHYATKYKEIGNDLKTILNNLK